MSPTANQYDAVNAVEKALAETEQLQGRPLSDWQWWTPTWAIWSRWWRS